MSNFPYNKDKDKGHSDEPPNGTPITFEEMRNFADTILFWHTNNRTSDFSESGDGFWDGTNVLALGLLELLSDPNAIHRLMTTGRQVKEQINTVYEVAEMYEEGKTSFKSSSLVTSVLNEVFKRKEAQKDKDEK